jgi:DNA-binding MurR/RpiR family transcriptional regulator
LTIEWSRKLKDKGVTVVSVTDSMLSPLSHGADIPLITPTSIPSFFESYTGPMSVLNALLAALALEHEGCTLHALEQTESALEDFDTYFPE